MPTQASGAGGGWYQPSTEKRAIGWVPVDDGGDLRDVELVGNRLRFLDTYYMLNTGAPATAWATKDIVMAPALGVALECCVRGHILHASTAQVGLYVRSGDSTRAAGEASLLALQQVANAGAGNSDTFTTDVNNLIQYMVDVASSTLSLRLEWIRMPHGMGRGN